LLIQIVVDEAREEERQEGDQQHEDDDVSAENFIPLRRLRIIGEFLKLGFSRKLL
jgi:hypothetical protein